jgi:neutral ceramidase
LVVPFRGEFIVKQPLATLLCVLLIAPAACAKPPPLPSWQAGTAKVVITPTHFMWMSGYGSRTKPAEGKVHELWAKALALQAPDGKRCVLITMDLVGIDRELSKSVCAQIEKRTNLPRSAIMLSVSHTHCGPVVGRNLRAMYFLDEAQHKLVDEYSADLETKLVQVTEAAFKDLKLVELTQGKGLATFATNRRTNKEADVPKLRELGRLKGPVDHDVPVLSVRDSQGKVRAVVFGYACHSTVLSFQQWCGDYPGFAQLELEKRYPGALALFWAGCGADQNPLPRRTVALAEAYGHQLANSVEAVLKAPMSPVAPKLATAYTEVDLPLADLPSREALVQDTLSKDRYIVSRAKLLLKQLEQQGSLRQTYPYPVQTWQLGTDLTWIALGGEVVVDYALRLKRELGPVWVAGYANDVMAYIPSLRVLKEGGYEGGGAMVYYGLPTVWSPRVEDTIIRAVQAQAKAMR